MEANWAGNVRYRAAEVRRPATLDELRELVAGAQRVRVLGTRHSFNEIADADMLVSVAGLPTDVVVDRAAMTVTCGAGLAYGELARALADEGVALHNLASLPHISVAGAVATGTHGSGDALGNLATAVAGLQLVTSDGDVLDLVRGDDGFDGIVVGLGALGAVTRVTLDVQPAYAVRQRVFEGLAWEALAEHFDAVTGAGDSVSVFTRWGESIEQVWVKTRVTDAPEVVRDELFGARAATVERHPIFGMDPVHATPQLGAPGLWSDRLPHFKMGFTPSAGDELQSEFLLARERALDAVAALRAIAGRFHGLLQVTELRTMAADALWLSPAHGRATVGVHFTWLRDWDAVVPVLAAVEETLAPFGARPHWGKLFLAPAARVAPLYERLDDFRALAARLDPRQAFRNEWLDRHLLDGAT